MKIAELKQVTFGDLELGQLFKSFGKVFVKVRNTGWNSICLNDSTGHAFWSYMEVTACAIREGDFVYDAAEEDDCCGGSCDTKPPCVGTLTGCCK